MLYAIISEDVADSLSRRAGARADHLARLERLRDQGRLVLAGPHPAVDSADPARPVSPAPWWWRNSIPWTTPGPGPTPTPISKPGFTSGSR